MITDSSRIQHDHQSFKVSYKFKYVISIKNRFKNKIAN